MFLTPYYKNSAMIMARWLARYILMTRPGAVVPGMAAPLLPGVPGLVVMTMYWAPGVPATPFGTAVMIFAGVAPAPAGRGDAITMVCLPAADCATAVPGLATGVPAVPRTPLARPRMMVAPPGNVWNKHTHTDRYTITHMQVKGKYAITHDAQTLFCSL